MNIDDILCRKEIRKVSQGSTFSFRGQTYQLSKNNQALPLPNKFTITVLTNPRFGMRAEYKGAVYQARKRLDLLKLYLRKIELKGL